MSAKKHSKSRKREIGTGRPTENLAIEGYTKGVISRLEAQLKYSPEPKEELREMVISVIGGDLRIEDLLVATKDTGMMIELKLLLAQYNLYLK